MARSTGQLENDCPFFLPIFLFNVFFSVYKYNLIKTKSSNSLANFMAKAGNNGKTLFKLDRKTVEKNRRIHMKSLCSKLFNLVPSSHYKISKDLLSQQSQISYVIAYINELKERVENLEKRKEALQLQTHSQLQAPSNSAFPVVEVRDLGSDIVHVTLISSINRSVMLNEIIGVVEEEGGQVVSASFTTLGDKVFHSLHIEVSQC